MEKVDLSKESIGQRIKRARRWIDMTQGELAQKLDLSPSGISNIETGERRVDLDMLPRIVEATGQSLLYFLGLEPLNETPEGFERGPSGTSLDEDEAEDVAACLIA
ncbi:MAG: helix-turn-helix transcriptional regulator [Dehalococcoidia bacterium]|nr:helix-turn-helix transcriptional regulator [Dehalococcoidia bacterium]